MSKGEQLLLEVLKEELPQYSVLSQKAIKINKKTLYFDYYIPMLNLAVEFDGSQHFQFNKFYHKTMERFKQGVKNDKEKNAYCALNNIYLIRIPHTVTDKDSMKQFIREAIKAFVFHQPVYK